MWDLISKLDWANNSKKERGYNDVKQWCLDNITVKDAEKLRTFVSARFKALYKLLTDLENNDGKRYGYYGGDDSFGDMIHHVIGLGKETYENIMSNPSLLDDIRPVESFDYCLPYIDEYDVVSTIDEIDNVARNHFRSLSYAINNTSLSGEEILDIKESVDIMLFIMSGDLKSAIAGLQTYNNNITVKIVEDCEKYLESS